MDKHVIVIEYIGEEPNLEAVRAAVEGIARSVAVADQTVNPIVLNEQDISKALYTFGLIKGSDTKSTLSVEIKRRKLSKRNIAEIIAKALENVEDI